MLYIQKHNLRFKKSGKPKKLKGKILICIQLLKHLIITNNP